MAYIHHAKAFAFAFLVYSVLVYIYRVYFHPLFKFAGPKLAAGTYWWEFCKDLDRKFFFRLDELHQKYGELNS